MNTAVILTLSEAKDLCCHSEGAPATEESRRSESNREILHFVQNDGEGSLRMTADLLPFAPLFLKPLFETHKRQMVKNG